MLKQDVFKDAFGQMGIYLHKLFKYLIAGTTKVDGLFLVWIASLILCLALASNHQALVASF